MDLMQILGFILSIIIASSIGLFYMGLSRIVTARIQNRIGPPVWQNVIDIAKLFSKKTQIRHGLMQHLGPAFAITASITTLMFVPILRDGLFFKNLSFDGDLIFLLYIMAFGSLGMALGAGQTGNPHSAIGVSRGLAQMVGYEIPFVVAMVAIMMRHGSTNLQVLMQAQNSFSAWNMFTDPFAFAAALLAFLGMMTYAPFDVPFAPAEIAAGPAAEFGGKYLGLMMTSRSIFTFGKLVLFVDLFMGGASNMGVSGFFGILIAFGILLLKTYLLYLVPLLVGIVNPRFRTEQAISFFWKWPLAFSIIAFLQVTWSR